MLLWKICAFCWVLPVWINKIHWGFVCFLYIKKRTFVSKIPSVCRHRPVEPTLLSRKQNLQTSSAKETELKGFHFNGLFKWSLMSEVLRVRASVLKLLLYSAIHRFVRILRPFHCFFLTWGSVSSVSVCQQTLISAFQLISAE